MPKQKSKLIGILLAVFTGPLSFLYVGKWKKALLLLPLMLVPYLNALIYFYCLFAIIGNVKKHNKENFNEARYNIVVCKCSAVNKSGSRFCSDCGKKLTKQCRKCDAQILNEKNYCNYCGYGFQDLIKKRTAIKKVAAFALTSLIVLLLFSLTFLVALEQHEAEKYIEIVKLANFQFPEKTGTNSFHIHYELTEKKIPGLKGLRTYINGTGIYTNDNEAVFDGKNIEWIVHLKKKGIIQFNITLYHNNQLLDSRQYSINATA